MPDRAPHTVAVVVLMDVVGVDQLDAERIGEHLLEKLIRTQTDLSGPMLHDEIVRSGQVLDLDASLLRVMSANAAVLNGYIMVSTTPRASVEASRFGQRTLPGS